MKDADMATQFEGGVQRAAEMVDGLTGDTESLLGKMADQLEGTIARNQELREGLMAQVTRLDELLQYQRGQLAAVRSAAERIPGSAVSEDAPQSAIEDIDLTVDPGDTDASLGDRVLVLLARDPQTTVDDLVAGLQAAGDDGATRRGVSTAITNLSRAGKVERNDDRVTLLG